MHCIYRDNTLNATRVGTAITPVPLMGAALHAPGFILCYKKSDLSCASYVIVLQSLTILFYIPESLAITPLRETYLSKIALLSAASPMLDASGCFPIRISKLFAYLSH